MKPYGVITIHETTDDQKEPVRETHYITYNGKPIGAEVPSPTAGFAIARWLAASKDISLSSDRPPDSPYRAEKKRSDPTPEMVDAYYKK